MNQSTQQLRVTVALAMRHEWTRCADAFSLGHHFGMSGYIPGLNPKRSPVSR